MSSKSMENSPARPSSAAQDHDLVITRIFNAPRELVWQAWTEPEYYKRWFGPKNYTIPHCTIDLRVGGRYHYCMRSPEGQDFWAGGVYQEISAPQRLVMTDTFADEQGHPVPASQYGMDADFPDELLIEVTIEPVPNAGGNGAGHNRTQMTLRHRGLPAGNDREMTTAGWNESFDKLAAALQGAPSLVAVPGKPEIVMSHVFDAPRELIFRALTDPQLIPRWWGPRHLTTTVEQMDLRPGGGWRFVQRDAEGNVFAFHGVYQEIVPPERVVDTFEFEGIPPGHAVVETMTLEDLGGGKTRLTTRSVYQSIEDRDGMLQSGMEGGATESLVRLAELLATLPNR